MLRQLDVIIDTAIATNSRMGLFAYVYRRTTAQILKEVELGNFEDNDRMVKFDVEFANFYLDAYHAYSNGLEVSRSWDFAFKNAKEPLTILQHVMLGINTHINLDLAMAVSTVMRERELAEIENDYNTVNRILSDIVNEMQDRLGRVSPLLFMLDWAGKNSDEKIIDFSMAKAREVSWGNANLLWGLGIEHQGEAIKNIDGVVLKLSEFIKAPQSKIIGFLLSLIGRFEERNIGKVIATLRED
ncbi:DUF5995 family protein [Pseudozobellia thermophila]|uniref:Uncharacterized protein n=1 Tax=Pseudozobellia thermophila TaxID=192903 RepID=A0A1M6NE62_9FLAO|nr:DUF5995 family protein [Pseudozobellia thermophila]SHJ94028.1 hypothetical protein SAMN04488513_11326 [Pseudozobellia thermophila]